ncbi:hypothetical protein ACE6H2_009735 [Prunus campanulata]
MASSSTASPFCTWLLAACISSPYEKNHPMRSSIFQSPKRLSQWARRKKLISKCSYGGGEDFARNLSSSFSVSGIHNLMSSFLAFEPCYDSKVLYESLALFGSKRSRTRRQRQMNGAVHSGITMAVPVQRAEQGTTKKKPLTKQRRVVVTGLGVVTPLGHDPDVFYNSLLEGVSGISEIGAFDCARFPTKIAGEIKSFSTDGWVSPKLSRKADKFMLYLISAGKKALADGGITEEVMDNLDKSRCGVIIGSALGGMKVFNDAIEALRISYKKMNPFCIPFATTNMGSAILAMDLGWMGPNYSISTACATSNFCILNAAYHIMRGETDMMLCGGSEAAIIPIGSIPVILTPCLGGFSACKVLSQRNSEPTKASCPWDINRDGFVIGEGAGVLLLEELEHAKLRVNSTKSMIGHLLGASGAVEAVATIKAIQTGCIHPNINLENPDENVDMNVLVGPKKEKLDIKVAMSNALGFGGHNSSILFAPHK